jgi:hypothetical protein
VLDESLAIGEMGKMRFRKSCIGVTRFLAVLWACFILVCFSGCARQLLTSTDPASPTTPEKQAADSFTTSVHAAPPEQSTNSSTSLSLTTLQVEKLVIIIQNNTPHNSVFSWVALDPEFYKNPPPIRDEVIKYLHKKFVVYESLDKIPSEKCITDSRGAWIGYVNGCRYSFTVEIINEKHVEVSWDYVYGNLGANGGYEKYEWTGKDWKLSGPAMRIIS